MNDITKKTTCELLFGCRVINPTKNVLNDVISDIGNEQIDTSLEEARAYVEALIENQNEASKTESDCHRKPITEGTLDDLVRCIRPIPVPSGQSKKLVEI